MNFVKRNLSHPWRAKLLTYLAAGCGVTPERFLEVVAKRKQFVRARMYRKRSRKRHMEKNIPKRDQRASRDILLGKAVYAGAGELHELLAILGWSMAEFCRYAGIKEQTVYSWRGHPMALWPIELLRQRIMIDRAKAAGVNMDGFLPDRLIKFPQGRYPRKRGEMSVDGKKLAEYSPWKK